MKRHIWGLVLCFAALSASASDRDSVVSQLAGYLTEIRLDKVRVKTLGSLVVLDGEVEVPQQLVTLENLVGGLQKAEPSIVFQSLVQVCPAAWLRLAERMEREIGSPEITVRVLNKSFLLEGVAQSDFEADRAVQILKTHLGPPEDRTLAATGMGVIVDMLRVAPRPGPAKKAPSKPRRQP